jgi:hypothetical protein
MLRWKRILQKYVSSVSDVPKGCCKCFIHGCCKSRSRCCTCSNGYTRMLQEFIQNVSSVVSDVSCKCVYLDVVYVSHICYKYFIWTLYMFAMAFKYLAGVFASVSDVCCKCFSCFGRMLQVFHLYIVKVDRVLHMLQCVWKNGGDASGTRVRSGDTGPRGRVKHWRGQGRAGAGMECRRVRETKCRHGRPDAGICPDVRALALLYLPYHTIPYHTIPLHEKPSKLSAKRTVTTLDNPLGQKRATH